MDGSEELHKINVEEVLHEINEVRQDPPLYSKRLAKTLMYFNKEDPKVLQIPGSPLRIRSHEGADAVQEAIRELNLTKPMDPVRLDEAMCRASMEAVDVIGQQAEVGRIARMKRLRQGYGCSDRLNRVGKWSLCCSENISFARFNARGIVFQMLIDDGVPSRGHRRNLLNPNFKVLGVAIGTHTIFKVMCVIDLAGDFASAQKKSRKKKTEKKSILQSRSLNRVPSLMVQTDSSEQPPPCMVQPKAVEVMFGTIGSYGFITLTALKNFYTKNQLDFAPTELENMLQDAVSYRLGNDVKADNIELLPNDVLLASGFRKSRNPETGENCYRLRKFRDKWISLLLLTNENNRSVVFTVRSQSHSSAGRLRKIIQSRFSIGDWTSSGDVHISSNSKRVHGHSRSKSQAISFAQTPSSATSHQRQRSKFGSKFHLLDVVAAAQEDMDFSSILKTKKSLPDREHLLAQDINQSIIGKAHHDHEISWMRPVGRIDFSDQANFNHFVDIYTSQKEAQRHKAQTKEDIVQSLVGERAILAAQDTAWAHAIAMTSSSTVADEMARQHLLKQTTKSVHKKPFLRFSKISYEKPPVLNASSGFGSVQGYQWRKDYKPGSDGKPARVIERGVEDLDIVNDRRSKESVLQQNREVEKLVQHCARKIVEQTQKMARGDFCPNAKLQPGQDPIEELHDTILQRHFLQAPTIQEYGEGVLKPQDMKKKLGIWLPDKKEHCRYLRKLVSKQVDCLLGNSQACNQDFKLAFKVADRRTQLCGRPFPPADYSEGVQVRQDEPLFVQPKLNLAFRVVRPSDRQGMAEFKQATK